MKHNPLRITEQGNTWTHLIGALFALSSIWMVVPAATKSPQMALGVVFFVNGMFLMFLASTLYHWVPQGTVKHILRRLDHISIYVMIACSYTPILIGVIGGWIGWLVFAIEWATVIGGIIYKLVAFGKYPRLSLALYLLMGWSVLLIMPQVLARLTNLEISLLLVEGLSYTAGTYFFSHDSRPHYHTIWHLFVLAGAMSHWTVILSLILA